MFIIQKAHEIKFNAIQALPPKAMGTGINQHVALGGGEGLFGLNFVSGGPLMTRF
jgi:hypothetical protein